MDKRPPVDDWATDYDLFDPDYVKDPAPVWDELRERCPIAHTERWGGSWLPTRYEDMQAFVRMVPELSSRNVMLVTPPKSEEFDAELAEYGSSAPPITSDPPEHIPMRRLILPLFTPKAVEGYRPFTEQLCHDLIDSFIEQGR
ncbi:MAG: cytochrome P450, partial [Alphaproteobacteria bacterium]|nr:cytochrome P450 [Alphaproteobacteria bacterium]